MNILNRFSSASAICLAGLLAGCAADPSGSNRNSQISQLDSSASLRVEVEVYKGPLSKEPVIQLGELQGILGDTQRALEILFSNIEISERRLDCISEDETPKVTRKPEKDEEKWISLLRTNARGSGDKAQNLSDYHIVVPAKTDGDKTGNYCNTLWNIRQDLIDLVIAAGQIVSIEPENEITADTPLSADGRWATTLIQCWQHLASEEKPLAKGTEPRSQCLYTLGELAKYGARLKRRGAYWATENAATNPTSTRLKIETAHLAQFTNEYGNQIISRADALMKQINGLKGQALAREQISNSGYLQNSSPTSFLRFYAWNEAAVLRSDDSPTDRVRMVEQLVADNYWSNINTVFTAGQGSVTTVLYKDDIGNWNIKNFDNSPGELLDAYKSVGLAAVKTVKELASSAGGLPAAQNALALADQIALGSTSQGRATETQGTIKQLRINTADQLKEIGDMAGKEIGEVDKDTSLTPGAKEDKVKSIRKETYEKMQLIINYYRRTLQSMEESRVAELKK